MKTADYKIALGMLEKSLLEIESNSYIGRMKLYPFTNEQPKNISEILEVKGKTVLSVLGGGDQAIQMLVDGADKIYAFDILKTAKYYSELKIAALKGLEYNEFEKYLTPNKEYFSPKIYNKIKENLPQEFKQFWNILMKDDVYGEMTEEYTKAFYEEYCTFFKKTGLYDNKSDFAKTKTRIIRSNPIEYLNLDFLSKKQVSEIPNDGYDRIYLSNIYSIIKDNKANRNHFLESIRILESYIKPGGIIMYGYEQPAISETKKHAIDFLREMQLPEDFLPEELRQLEYVPTLSELLGNDCSITKKSGLSYVYKRF